VNNEMPHLKIFCEGQYYNKHCYRKLSVTARIAVEHGWFSHIRQVAPISTYSALCLSWADVIESAAFLSIGIEIG